MSRRLPAGTPRAASPEREVPSPASAVTAERDPVGLRVGVVAQSSVERSGAVGSSGLRFFGWHGDCAAVHRDVCPGETSYPAEPGLPVCSRS